MNPTDYNSRVRKFARPGDVLKVDRLVPAPVLRFLSGVRGTRVVLRDKTRKPVAQLSSVENRLQKYEEAIAALLARLTLVRDQERQKIANELHDQIGQNLVLAKMRLGALKSRLPKEYSVLLGEVGGLIDDTIKDTRSLIHELCPEFLQEIGLDGAFNCLAEQIQVKYRLPCSVEIVSLPRSLGQGAQLAIFQAVRELLINVAKHAQASRAEVVCACGEGFLRIQVLDDGKGFDPVSRTLPTSDTGKFGLLSIRARLAPLGGKMDIDSRVGAGTRVTITLPLDTNLTGPSYAV